MYAHPLWGKEKTDRYYSEWECLPNAQLETGEYVDLFMTSDAMIHDCGSFTIEYHYTLKPVMYLVNGREHTKMMNAYAKEAYDLHYKGKNMKDIRSFIENVISERSDYLLEKRKIFLNHTYYLPIISQQLRISFMLFWELGIMQKKTNTSNNDIRLRRIRFIK